MRKLLFILSIFVCLKSFATIYPISSAAGIATLPTINPGDVIQLNNGTWTNQYLSFTGLHGTALQPIYIRAQTNGSVILNGTSQFYISVSDYVIIKGLFFYNGATDDSTSILIQLSSTTHYCRITNCKVDGYDGSDSVKQHWWVKFGGYGHRLDHCNFLNKRNVGSVIDWDMNEGSIAATDVDSNYFQRNYNLGTNGGEILRVGCCDTKSEIESYVLVYDNYFDQCKGEGEIVSLKTSFVTIKHNTFSDCKGTISIRQGHDSRVEQNFILGTDSSEGGVAAYGRDHHIVNNYIVNFRTVNPRAAVIYMPNGESFTDCTSYGDLGYIFQQPKRIHFDSNIIINDSPCFVMGYRFFSSKHNQNLNPLSISFRGNLIQNLNAPIEDIYNSPIFVSGSENYYSNATTRYPDIFTNLNPLMVADVNGIYRITSSSPDAVKVLDNRSNLIYSRTSTIVPIKKTEVGVTW